MTVKKKLVYGVGVNDADYIVQPLVDGKKISCPFYRKWKDMIRRCYSEKHLKNRPTYKGCSVSDEWLVFSKFKKWMEAQDWQGNHLDKDILDIEGKIYSSERCVFVSSAINALLNEHAATRGKYKKGVHWHKRDHKFMAQLSVNGEKKHLGYFDTEDEAYAVYVEFKSAHIREVAETQEPRVRDGLIRHAELLENSL